MPDITPAPALSGEGLALDARRRSEGWLMVRNAFRSGLRVAAARRDRVLAHPDLAALLCEPPLSLSSPGIWTGFIPPAEVPMYPHHEKPNRSPARAQLIEVCRLVAERETEQAAAQSEDA